MMGYPIVFNIILSFQDVTAVTLLNPVKEFIGFKNYIDVIKDPVFLEVLKNSFIFTVGCIFFQFTIGLALALLFNLNFPLAGSMRGILLITLMVPSVVVSIIFRWLLSGDFGLINELLVRTGLLHKGIAWLAEPKTALGGVMLANIWIGISFNTMLLAPGIASISPSLYEAAAIDGAGPIKRFRYITLPLLRPTILIVLVLGFIYTFRIFGLIYAMTSGGPVNATTVLPIQAYKLSFSFFKFGQGAAATIILLSILLIIILVYLRLVGKEEVME
jgi:multiple sugar transport system permease protein